MSLFYIGKRAHLSDLLMESFDWSAER